MTKVREIKIPKRVEKVVNRCRNGGYVIKSMPVYSTGESVPKWSYHDGRDAPEISVTEAITRGLLVPQSDGLFGAESLQTFRAA